MGSIQPPEQAPAESPIDISSYPKLDLKQAGHLRHFHNLVSQPDGEWRHFENTEVHQEFDDAIRYQLALMAYAAGAAHYHRLPALRGPFQSLMRQMIRKMLRREVWGYWFTSSHGGNIFDPDLKELRKPWADPVMKENIMYSGHLLLMTSLYEMLFDDDEFKKPGGLTLRWDPLFWGLGHEDFVYDNRSLQKVILEQMRENEWVGVCCEPNAIFVNCNQLPLIAMRYNDVRDGTDIMGDVLPKYKAALIKKGMLGRPDGLYGSFYALKQKTPIPPRHGAHTAWANTFMHGWDPEGVRARYDQQTLGFLTNFNNKTELHLPRVAMAFRKLVLEEGEDPHGLETLRKAREESRHVTNPRIPFETLNWLFPMMLSELGKQKELNDLLEYADSHLNPTWERGGLYYPRNDQLVDKDWNLTHMEPHSGNSGMAYARLNVESGQRKMWLQPWTREVLSERPWVDGVSFADDVDFLRALWDGDVSAMIITVKRWQGDPRPLTMSIRGLPGGHFGIYVRGSLRDTRELSKGDDIAIREVVGQDEVDIVVKEI